MTTTADCDLLIVGGGMVGLSLALGVARDGLSVAVVERDLQNPQSPIAGHYAPRVSAISRQSQEWLCRLGVWHRLPEGRACAYHKMQVWDGQGHGSIAFDADEIQADNLGHIVENRWLVQALWQQAEQTRGIRLLVGRTLQHWQDDGDLVQTSLDDETPVSARVLAACDGRFSRVRETAGLETREWDYNQQAVVTTVRHQWPHRGTARQVFLETGPLAFLPLGDETGDQNSSSIVWSVDNEFARELQQLRDSEFRLALNRAFGDSLGKLTDSDERLSFPLQQMHSKAYIAPRLALVGDAAHSIHPLAGQGVNLGFQDARVLAGEFHRARQRAEDIGGQQTLRRYQRQRQPHNLAAMATMEGFKRLFSSDDPVAVLSRNWGMGQLDRMALAKRALIKTALGHIKPD